MENTTNNIIASAVEPQRAAAIEAVRVAATERIERFRAQLAEHNGNVGAFAPRPVSHQTKETGTKWCGRGNWKATERAHKFAMSITTDVNDQQSEKWSRWYDPSACRAINEAAAQRWIDQCADAADADYSAFISKLTAKVGDVVTADLAGDHVWSHSVLTVERADGSVERWKTQRIINTSVHGLLFNQWPTRKVK